MNIKVKHLQKSQNGANVNANNSASKAALNPEKCLILKEITSTIMESGRIRDSMDSGKSLKK